MQSTVSSDGRGNYQCGDCGHKWKARDRYQWWPIRLKWRPKSATKFFAWHGWQTGWDGIEQRVYGQTFHIGALKVCFGANVAPTCQEQHPDEVRAASR